MAADPTIYRYLGEGLFFAPDGTLTRSPAAHAEAHTSPEQRRMAIAQSLASLRGRLGSSSARTHMENSATNEEASRCRCSGSAIEIMASALLAILSIAASSSTPRATSSASTAARRNGSMAAPEDTPSSMPTTPPPRAESGQQRQNGATA